jgi:hypothetical protein
MGKLLYDDLAITPRALHRLRPPISVLAIRQGRQSRATAARKYPITRADEGDE